MESIAQKPTLLTIRVSFTQLLSVHSPTSTAVSDAIKLLTNEIERLIEKVENSYNDEVLMAAVTSKQEVLRNKRQTQVIVS